MFDMRKFSIPRQGKSPVTVFTFGACSKDGPKLDLPGLNRLVKPEMDRLNGVSAPAGN